MIWCSWISGPRGAVRAVHSAQRSEKASEANPDVYFAKVDIDQNPPIWPPRPRVQSSTDADGRQKQQIIFQQAGALRASDLDDLISQAKALDMDAAASDGDTASSGRDAKGENAK